MTPHPAAVAALRIAGCPWLADVAGLVPVCVPAATDGYKRVVTAGDQQEAIQASNGRAHR